MAEITASMVMDLRSRTGLPMMECKKALAETGGDAAKAEELLRIRSGARASKAADRIAAEGVFVAFARKLAQVVAEKNPADAASLASSALDGGTVENARKALVQKIGENVSI